MIFRSMFDSSTSKSLPPSRWIRTSLTLGLLTFCTCSQVVSAGTELDRLVACLDQIRIPPQSVAATLEIRQPSKPAEPAQTFKTFTQVAGGDSHRTTAALMLCTAPPKDAGKRLLFRDDACWFYDPKAKHPTKVPPAQMWSQPMSSDSPSWRLKEDFTATQAGRENILCGDGTKRNCTVIEFVPSAKGFPAPAKMRYWVDDSGRYWRVEHFTASGRLFKTIDHIRYARVLGADRVAAMRICSGAETAEVTITDMVARKSPPDWFDPEKLPLVMPSPD